ncbi:MAG: hypothetical protein IJH14_08455 [Solobacterium sp.]|nr:hypothetical protein [Solobacterium sp.]
MAEKIELTEEQIARISAGTSGESVDLMLALAAEEYGPYIKVNENRNDLLDIEGMQEFFASRGYKFIPAFGDQELNLFIAPDGLPYGNDYIIHLLRNGGL